MNCHQVFLALLASCSVLHGQMSFGDSAPMAKLDHRRILEAGDWLIIQVSPQRQVGKDRSLTWVNQVVDSGAIPLPLLAEHQLNAIGLTCREFAYKIKRELENNYLTTFTVIVKLTTKPKNGSMEALDNKRRLKANDAVSIRIKEDKREAFFQTVAVTGEIQCPYIGLMKAKGLTCQELAFQCKTELEKNFFKTATVLVSLADKLPDELVHVISCRWPDFVVANGSFSKPGKYDLPFDHDLTVTGLLQRAGGHRSKNFAPKIQIIRKTPQGNKRILVNTQAVLIEKRSEYDLFLRRNDVVIVE
ncbi:MAG: polysaccharide biosynthesis/export family protein [Prosthecobacter sp.]|nr:polysaccharide biosynthesis/export family protein [Prosthecobacter sp.]